MRTMIGLALLAILPGGCGSGGGGDGLGGYIEMKVTVADLAAPHGYWKIRDLNNTPGAGITPLTSIRLREGERVPISAVPDPSYHVVWHGTDDDTASALTNTFHAAAGKTVTVEFLP